MHSAVHGDAQHAMRGVGPALVEEGRADGVIGCRIEQCSHVFTVRSGLDGREEAGAHSRS